MSGLSKAPCGVIGNGDLGRPDGLFLACASFEDRCASAAHALAPEYRTSVAAIVRYWPGEGEADEFEGARDENTGDLIDRLGAHSDEPPRLVLCERMDPETGTQILIERLGSKLPPHDAMITIDMSTFTKIHLWHILRFFTVQHSYRNVRVVYAPAGPSGVQSLTSGPFAAHCDPVFGGRFSASRTTVLSGFIGLEPERAIRIFEEYEPDVAKFWIATGRRGVEFRRQVEAANEFLLSRPGVSWSDMVGDGLQESINALSSVSVENADSNYVLLCLGSKIQNLAGFLFWRQHPDVRLAYAWPSRYSQRLVRRKGHGLLTFELRDLLAEPHS